MGLVLAEVVETEPLLVRVEEPDPAEHPYGKLGDGELGALVACRQIGKCEQEPRLLTRDHERLALSRVRFDDLIDRRLDRAQALAELIHQAVRPTEAAGDLPQLHPVGDFAGGHREEERIIAESELGHLTGGRAPERLQRFARRACCPSRGRRTDTHGVRPSPSVENGAHRRPVAAVDRLIRDVNENQSSLQKRTLLSGFTYFSTKKALGQYRPTKPALE